MSGSEHAIATPNLGKFKLVRRLSLHSSFAS